MLLVGAGVTLYECIKAHDLLASENVHVGVIDLFSVKPIDAATLAKQAQRVGGKVLTVEDHYGAGGIGEAVCSALADQPGVRVRSLCVKGGFGDSSPIFHLNSILELPRSGTPDGLMDLYGISAKCIVKEAKNFL